MNKVILLGNLTKDPEMRVTPNNGTPRCTFSVACNRPYKNQQTGERETDFINCVAWRQTAEFIQKYFVKGQKILVEGSIQTRTYDDKSGQKKYFTEVIVDKAEFAGSKSDGQPQNYTQRQTQNYAPPTPRNDDPFAGDYAADFEPIPDSELPF